MNSLKPDLIWRERGLDELETRNDFQKHTLVVKIFSFCESVKELYPRFIRYVEPFVQHYPWNIGSPQFDVFTHKGYTYLYGELVFDENINDEWLLIRLCWEFSGANPGVFISLWDSLDNELLLVQAYNIIQDWMNPGNSSNRPWLVNGEVVIVAEENKDYLTLESIVTSMEKGDYDKDWKLTEYYNDWLKMSDSYFFEMIYDVELTLPKIAIEAFVQRPFLIARSIQKYSTEKLQVNQMVSEFLDEEKIKVKLGVPLLSLSIVRENELSLMEKPANIFPFNSLMENMLLLGLDRLSKEEPQLIQNIAFGQSAKLSPSRSFLQEKLIALNRLSGIIPPDEDELNKLLTFVPGQESVDDKIDNELIEKLTEFFDDQSAGLEGINNQQPLDLEETNSKLEEERDRIQDIQALQKELGDDFSDFIDFCIEQRGNKTQPSKRKRKTREWKQYNNESEYHTDTSTEYYPSSEEEEDFLNDPRFKKMLDDGDSVEALTSLLSNIKTDIGPGSILLEQGIKNAK